MIWYKSLAAITTGDTQDVTGPDDAATRTTVNGTLAGH